MTLTKTFIPYNRQPEYDEQILALEWETAPPDATRQELPLANLVFTIRDFLGRKHDLSQTLVSSSTFLCYDPTNLNVRLLPDLYVAFGVEETAIRNRDAGYLIWEVGKQPDFVLELASPSTARNDLYRKRDLYAQIGIPEYWRFDATGGDHYGIPLAGDKLVDGKYQPISLTDEPDGQPKGYSQVLDLVLSWHNGDFRIYDRELDEYSLTTWETLAKFNEHEAIIEEQADMLQNQASMLENQRTLLNMEAAARRAAEERAQELEEEIRQIRASGNGNSS